MYYKFPNPKIRIFERCFYGAEKTPRSYETLDGRFLLFFLFFSILFYIVFVAVSPLTDNRGRITGDGVMRFRYDTTRREYRDRTR